MNPKKSLTLGLKSGALALAVAALLTPSAARANVYATDIQINNTLTGSYSDAVGTPVSITYHLNDNATAGVTVKILSGTAVVSTISIASPNAGTLQGLNTVSYTPTSAGTYSVSITAAATGYTNWQQYTPLTTNFTTVFPHGIAVDQNTTSPYYGRVIVGCGTSGTAHGVAQLDGLYKYNADGTPADEGWFGYAQYTTDDGGMTTAAQAGGVNQMANGRAATGNTTANPYTIRIGEDDRIYWDDDSDTGAILACDMQAIGPASVIINEAGYASCPASGAIDVSGNGWRQFDIINTTTTSDSSGTAAIFLNDEGDFPCQGIWMWHMVGTAGTMVADPTDTGGTQAVYAGTGSANSLRTDGITVDYALDFFVGQDRVNNTDPTIRTACYTNWNGGVLPAGNNGYNLPQEVAYWTSGGGDNTDTGVYDSVIDSKTNPNLLATAMQTGFVNNQGGFQGHSAGIRLLNAFNAVVSLTGISSAGGNVTINASCSSTQPLLASQLSLMSSTNVAGPFATNATAVFTGTNGAFQTTVPSPGIQTYYIVSYPQVGAGTVALGTATAIDTSGPVTGSLSNMDVGNYYFSAAWDNVGNLYGATTTDNYWRAFSPPGPNKNTTLAVATLTAH